MNILFLSVGRRGELIKNFKKEFEGLGNIVAADNQNTAPALYFADKRYTVPLITEANYIDVVIDICKKENINAVTTFIDTEIELLAKNRERFSDIGVILLAPYEETAKLCFDKYAMYEFLVERGFKTPKTYKTVIDFLNAKKEGVIDFPVFVKPRTGSGSVGIKKISNYDDLCAYVDNGEDYIIQELMIGEEFDADVYADALSGELVSIFTKKKISSRIGGADKTVSFKDDRLFDLITNFVSCLKLCGPADIDFFYRNGEYYISEVNPRFGGAYIHAYGCGVNFPKLIQNNIKGVINKKIIGDYEQGIYMLMFDSVVITKCDN